MHNAGTYRLLLCMCVGHAVTKSTNFGSRYLVEGLRTGRRFVSLIEAALLYITTQIGGLWSKGSPWGARLVNGVKKRCNAFLEDRLAERDEIWHLLGSGQWKRVPPNSVNFGRGSRDTMQRLASVIH